MEIKSISSALVKAHESVENLHNVMEQAKADRRFHFTLADSRKFRDLSEDMEKMLGEAWMASIEVPLVLPVNGQMQKVQIKIEK